MAKGLKTLIKHVRKNHHLRIITTFDNSILPGTILNIRSDTNIAVVGFLWEHSAVAKTALASGEPTVLSLADLERNSEIKADAAVDLLKPKGTAKGAFKKAKKVILTFDEPKKYMITWAQIGRALRADNVLNELPAKTLARRNFFVVSAIVKAKTSFQFHGSGNIALDLKAEGMKDVTSAKIDASWTWDKKMTISSKKEQLIAVKLLRYNLKKHKLSSVS